MVEPGTPYSAELEEAFQLLREVTDELRFANEGTIAKTKLNLSDKIFVAHVAIHQELRRLGVKPRELL